MKQKRIRDTLVNCIENTHRLLSRSQRQTEMIPLSPYVSPCLRVNLCDKKTNRFHPLVRIVPGIGVLTLCAALLGTPNAAAQPPYPDLRDAHDAELQAAMDQALGATRDFWDGVRKRELSIVVADVTDLRHPRVAWYNPDLMLYAASLPKIAIVFGVFVEVDRGALTLDDETRQQLIRAVRNSSNRDATALLNKVGFERLAEILQDERHGKLYDVDHGGGLWVGKAYAKGPAGRRDPLHGISHGASAMQAARFYYGVATGTLIDPEHFPLLEEIFGNPAIKHKFVKGLEGREGVSIFRKSGTWRDYHADSALVERDDLNYIVVYIDQHPDAGHGAVEGIKIVDDVMLEQAGRKGSPSAEQQ